jgi:hypothetical protein
MMPFLKVQLGGKEQIANQTKLSLVRVQQRFIVNTRCDTLPPPPLLLVVDADFLFNFFISGR